MTASIVSSTRPFKVTTHTKWLAVIFHQIHISHYILIHTHGHPCSKSQADLQLGYWGVMVSTTFCVPFYVSAFISPWDWGDRTSVMACVAMYFYRYVISWNPPRIEILSGQKFTFMILNTKLVKLGHSTDRRLLNKFCKISLKSFCMNLTISTIIS